MSPNTFLLDDALPGGPLPNTDAGTHAGRSWVPIRSLGTQHRQRLIDHLYALDESDRFLRFGYHASDERIASYVAQIDFDRDRVLGVFDRRLEMVAQAHLAFYPGAGEANDAKRPAAAAAAVAAEFGVSVLPRARGQGIGSLLFEHAVVMARNRGVRQLHIHLLRENKAMLAIVTRAGATIDLDGGEATARVTLPADTLGSHIGELIGHRAADLDYRFKLQVLRLDALRPACGSRVRSVKSVANGVVPPHGQGGLIDNANG